MIVLSVVFVSNSLLAQENISRTELENILSNFTNYRYGTITIWKYKKDDVEAISRAVQTATVSAAQVNVVTTPNVEKVLKNEELKQRVTDAVAAEIDEADREWGAIKREITRMFQKETGTAYELTKDEFEALKAAVRSQGAGDEVRIRNAYLITTHSSGDYKGTIIATLITKKSSDDIVNNMSRVNPSDIFVAEEMRLFTITDTAETFLNITNMYELAERRLAQGNLVNATLDAQGIGNINWFGNRNFGNVNSLFQNEWDLQPEDIQSVIKITEKQPEDQYLKENEVIASMDLISWKRYLNYLTVDEEENVSIDTLYPVNSALPAYGMELKYGISEINYPSLWSERLTLSAVWDRVKLGVILPTTGWSSIAESWFSQTRKLTGGGFGVAAEMDFPFKVIPKSGVFHGSIAYVFGDAKRFFNKDASLDEFAKFQNTSDYMIRFNSQLHYTFAMTIDDNYLFRFGIGGTVYTAERWMNFIDTVDIDEGEIKLGFKSTNSITVGGVSGKVDFMAKNIETPYGGSIQYFDEGIGMNLWLQLPIISKSIPVGGGEDSFPLRVNSFSIRLEANGYYKAFKDNPRPWENRSVFIPTARFIVFF